MNKYIVLDTETGGIGPEVSLLTAWLGVYDEHFQLLDKLDLRIKPKDKIYKVTAEALDINKINIIEHDKVAKTESECGTLLFNFLSKHSDQGAIKLIPVGQNVKFDIIKIYSNIISQASWEKFVSYRTLDTGVIAQFLKLIGKLPESVSGGLGTLATHFNISPEGSLHDAEVDAKVTLCVLLAMRDLFV